MNKPLIVALLGVFLIGLYFTLTQTQKPQEIRSRAATASTTLSFNPVSTGTNPIQKQLGETIALDMMVDPGNNHVSFVKFQVKYDPTKLALSTTNPFTVNTEALPINVEGPITGSGLLGQSLSIGADPTKVIQTKTKVGTVNFTAIGGTNGTSTIVSFTSITQALSAGPNDNSYQSVLQSTTPATIIIGGNSNITPTVIGDPCQDFCPTVTPGPTGAGTTVTFDLLLHGVGAAGDNPNPSGSSLSNKSPVHPQRNLSVQILDESNKLVSSSSGAINYDAQSGSFKGSIAFAQAIKEGNYIIKVQTPRYLRKRIQDVQKITPLRDNNMPKTDMIAGDTNGDNALDILDYNGFLNCGYGVLEPLPMGDPNSVFNQQACKAHKQAENIDVNDNGIIDSADYNLFLRELSVQSGD
jgi:hypothetical protein